MMGIETIRAMAHDRALEAEARGLEPLEADTFDEIRAMPNLGEYRPDGWELVEEHFVDSSGFGSPSEPALTIEQFTAVIDRNPGFGWAIVQEGQFQIYVGQFERSQ